MMSKLYLPLSLQADTFSYSIFNTSWGWMGIVNSERGLRRIILPQSSYDNAHQIITTEVTVAKSSKNDTSRIIQKLKSYLQGENVVFSDPLDLSPATQFQQGIRQVICSIPYGETRSYSWVANEIGKPGARRAVGQVLAHNPIPIIIPCHRVIASDGSLHGFQRGLKMKQRLLSLEKHQLENQRYGK